VTGTASGPPGRRRAASRSRWTSPAGARQRDRLARAEAAAAQQDQQQDEQPEASPEPGPAGRKKRKPKPVHNITDPDSALMPVRGGGLKQGYNCQDVAADARRVRLLLRHRHRARRPA